MPRVVHFDIACDQPERAIEFYKKVFGWRIEKWNNPSQDYWMVYTGKGPGIDGGLGKRMDSDQHITSTIAVRSVDEYIKKVIDAGGKIVVPKMAIPTVGWIAYFVDTEGNKFGIMENDKKAK